MSKSANYFPSTRRKTKIVATFGPASSDPKVVRELIEAGLDVARLNFSHGDHDSHRAMFKIIREEAQKAGRHIAILQDLCGPKVRIGSLVGGNAELVDGASLVLAHGDGEVEGTAEKIYVPSFDPAKVVRPGEKILLADGHIVLEAKALISEGIKCEVLSGGALRSRSGISVPDSQLDLPCLTEKDLKDLDWTAENKPDFVALSFVSCPQDIWTLKAELEKRDAATPIVAKIERASALVHMEEIAEVADAVMVARGDLGLELPLERVPSAQKFVIEVANSCGTPVITATQMLVSMVHQVRPTRAEVTDIATAVRDGTDAVMLSEETAIGKHPPQVIRVLDTVLSEVEEEFVPRRLKGEPTGREGNAVPEAVCYAACGAASKIKASAIIACTLSGRSALLIARYRPRQRLFGASTRPETLRRLSLVWGVQPVDIELDKDSSTEREVGSAMLQVRDLFGLKPGSRVVLTAGLRALSSGATCLMEVREIPR